MSKSKVSLRVKLIGMSMGIVFSLGLGSFVLLNNLGGQQEIDRATSMRAFAQTISDGISAQFFERYGDVQAFAMNPDLKANSRQTIVDALNSYVALYGIYDLILLTDSNGRLVAVNDKGPDGKELNVKPLYSKDYRDAPWFKDVMTGKFTEDKAKNFLGTHVEDIQIDPYVTEVLGEKRLGSSFSAPMKDSSGKTVGVISNRAGSRWFEVAFKEVYAALKTASFHASKLEIFNRSGTLLFEYFSDPTKAELDAPKYDFERLTKLDVRSLGAQAFVSATEGKAGNTIEVHKGEKTVFGFAPVSGPKFVDSIGWSIAVHDDYSEVMKDVISAKKLFYGVFSALLLLAIGFAYWFSDQLSKTLVGIAQKLSAGSSEVANAAELISTSSVELSEAATEQAAAIQETAASIDEVSAMVKKSAENASQSQKVSQQSREAAEEGQRAIQEMMESIQQISESNAKIMNQVDEVNRQISEIVKVIGEIGNKTKVINDIVFQTKLLSFNASVEAARAGEHGKGFAVVAEEVGNLAQMSGNAAKEISAMLDSSIQKVEGIVNETKTRVERLVVEGKEKVDSGTDVAKKCGETLERILGSVQEVDGMVAEISSASHEQSQGVSEINKAVNQLDQVTQKNTSVAQQSAKSSEQLKAQASDLKYVVSELIQVVSGGDTRLSGVGTAPSHTPKSGTPPTSFSGGNVTPITKAKQRQTTPKTASTVEFSPVARKKAVGAPDAGSGGSGDLPSKDDPRFEDA